jgi:hypothetical protein
MEWRTKSSLMPKKVGVQKLRITTMFITFDKQGMIHKEFLLEGRTVNSEFHLQGPERLLKGIS